jgi:hypothetical protein
MLCSKDLRNFVEPMIGKSVARQIGRTAAPAAVEMFAVREGRLSQEER